ncbi:MAG: DUF938 domain-containing protein [Kiloniellaceae bacterium]
MSDPRKGKRWTERSSYLVAVGDESASRERHCAPAAARNLEPILAVLRDTLPDAGAALEIASGTGQHVAAFAAAFPGIEWQPSDPDPAARASNAAWAAEAGLDNIQAPLALDVTAPDWEGFRTPPVDAILCINLLHIAPWAACEGLMRGAGRLLAPSGVLYLYGPYKRDGGHTAPSNAEFDRSLRHRDPAWGVRDLDDVAACAQGHGLALARVVEMPANNLSLIFRRRVGRGRRRAGMG